MIERRIVTIILSSDPQRDPRKQCRNKRKRGQTDQLILCVETAVIPAFAGFCFRVEPHIVFSGDNDILVLHQNIEQLVSIEEEHISSKKQPEAVAVPQAVCAEKPDSSKYIPAAAAVSRYPANRLPAGGSGCSFAASRTSSGRKLINAFVAAKDGIIRTNPSESAQITAKTIRVVIIAEFLSYASDQEQQADKHNRSGPVSGPADACRKQQKHQRQHVKDASPCRQRRPTGNNRNKK